MKILVVEDESDLRDAIVSNLIGQGYICEFAEDYRQAEDKLLLYEYALVVLDIQLPGGSGFDLLRWLKKEMNNTGVLILSAFDSLDHKINGLDRGADDYLTKPFHLSELNSRINAIIRRRIYVGSSTLIFNEIELNHEYRSVTINREPVPLTKKEYDLLNYFMINKKRVLTKESIAEHLCGDDIDLANNFDFIYTHIKNLRQKITKHGGEDYIKTVYGMGYKMTDR